MCLKRKVSHTWPNNNLYSQINNTEMESPLQPTLLMLLLRCEDTFVLFKLRDHFSRNSIIQSNIIIFIRRQERVASYFILTGIDIESEGA